MSFAGARALATELDGAGMDGMDVKADRARPRPAVGAVDSCDDWEHEFVLLVESPAASSVASTASKGGTFALVFSPTSSVAAASVASSPRLFHLTVPDIPPTPDHRQQQQQQQQPQPQSQPQRQDWEQQQEQQRRSEPIPTAAPAGLAPNAVFPQRSQSDTLGAVDLAPTQDQVIASIQALWSDSNRHRPSPVAVSGPRSSISPRGTPELPEPHPERTQPPKPAGPVEPFKAKPTRPTDGEQAAPTQRIGPPDRKQAAPSKPIGPPDPDAQRKQFVGPVVGPQPFATDVKHGGGASCLTSLGPTKQECSSNQDDKVHSVHRVHESTQMATRHAALVAAAEKLAGQRARLEREWSTPPPAPAPPHLPPKMRRLRGCCVPPTLDVDAITVLISPMLLAKLGHRVERCFCGDEFHGCFPPLSRRDLAQN